MGDPIWVDYDCVTAVDTPEKLAAMTRSGRHLVLRFPVLTADERAALIASLSAALGDHAVFDSGGPNHSWVTVLPVVARSRILERRAPIFHALAEYKRLCATLAEQYTSGTLSGEWQASEHGDHCCFLNRRTGQRVEAPLTGEADPGRVDPYFLALFLRSTAGFESVAELVTNDFHDVDRMLRIVADGLEPGDDR
ncbi:MAG: hypothetical protein H7Z41_14290 [Cytophagales bacterium]|nr:hypothetical protein [Armatimonadota bacterium]